MIKGNNSYVKVLFRYHSDVLEEIVIETMWATEIDKRKGIYKLNSIPFYGPPVATDDEFYAEFDKSEQRLTYRKTTKFSGNSIIQLIILNNKVDIEEIRNEFKLLNCLSERLNDRYLSMEILAATNYLKIKNRLDYHSERGMIEYAEPCLSEKHKKEIINLGN